MDTWRTIYEYDVSSTGSVLNPKTGRLLRPYKDRYGYLQVDLCKDGIKKQCSVHRLVGMVFPDLVGWTEDAIGKPFEELQINHKDKNPTNNRVENLEWCDCPYNIRYSQAKTVYMYTQDDKLCGMWPSTMECDRNGFSSGHITDCCNGKLKKYKGFKWSYDPPKPLLALPFYQL